MHYRDRLQRKCHREFLPLSCIDLKASNEPYFSSHLRFTCFLFLFSPKTTSSFLKFTFTSMLQCITSGMFTEKEVISSDMEPLSSPEHHLYQLSSIQERKTFSQFAGGSTISIIHVVQLAPLKQETTFLIILGQPWKQLNLSFKLFFI